MLAFLWMGAQGQNAVWELGGKAGWPGHGWCCSHEAQRAWPAWAELPHRAGTALVKALSCSATCHISHGRGQATTADTAACCNCRSSGLTAKPKHETAEKWSGNLCFQKPVYPVGCWDKEVCSPAGVHLVFPVLVLARLGGMVNSVP